MNIEHAKAIPLSEILSKIGCEPTRSNGHEAWYLSPLRVEKTASFHIHTAKNIWHDFGLNEGGNAFDFVCAYLKSQNEDHTPADALRWFRNMMPLSQFIPYPQSERETDHEPALQLMSSTTQFNASLTNYLSSRGIPLAVAKKYLKQVYLRNEKTKKRFAAFGMPTEEGYEFRNKILKGCINKKSVSVIRGRNVPAKEVHVFEGMMDFLSAVQYQDKFHFEGDVIILNSVNCLKRAFPYIKDYHYEKVYGWLDNDSAGEKTTLELEAFAKECGLPFTAMNKLYASCKDVNEWHMRRHSLKHQPSLKL